jgi:riboflavin kinase/FMN adenylyltransferase
VSSCRLLPAAATAVTVGTFDGVHLGHRLVLDRLVELAQRQGVPSVVVTFQPHPLEIVNPAAAPPLLTTWEEKLEVLAATGANYVVLLPFTQQLAAFEAGRFVDEILLGRLRMKWLVMGYDHGFGRQRGGDVETLQRLGEERAFAVSVVPPVVGPGGRPISSTLIRRALAGGDLDKAAAALGRPYSVAGRVAQGVGRGRLLGFPTINVPLPGPRKLLPPQGVYAVKVQTPAGPLGGMLNLGPRPTFGDSSIGIEAHLFDSESNLYGLPVRIDFIRRLRDTRSFPDAAALAAQLERDAQEARAILAASA